jgi:hypothetical protein
VLQRAVAYGLDQEGGFYCGLGQVLAGKRALLEAQLADLGFAILPAQVGGACALVCCALEAVLFVVRGGGLARLLAGGLGPFARSREV